jgi:histidinol-phosphatase (PHP family)
LRTIAITDHVEWKRRDYGFSDFEVYFDEVYQARERYGPRGLTVLSGVEVGNPHHYPFQFSALRAVYPFEVVIASLHWIGDHNIHYPAVFDGRDPHGVYVEYFRELRSLVEFGGFDILAHPDRIFWAGIHRGSPPDFQRLEPAVRSFTDRLAASDHALELNTKYLDQYPGWNRFPAILLRWFHEAGGQLVVMNSDAHTPDELARNFSAGWEVIRSVGLTKLTDLAPAYSDLMIV